jgi:predicted P-loop ATPase
MFGLKNHLDGRYEFRRNEITCAIDYREIGEPTFKPFDTQARNSLLVDLEEHYVKCSGKQLDTLLGSSYSRKFNPVYDYLNGLQWDGHDHLAELISSVKTDDDLFFKCTFKKFMVASVAGWLRDDQYNETMLVLIGNQNVGKSTFARNLLPDAFRRDYLYQGALLQNHNDFLKQASRKLFILLDEFDAITGRDIPRLKELITREVVETRLAYHQYDIKEPRRASFIATTNVSQPLRDLSGNRRYLCFLIRDIDRSVNVNIDQVYAQVYHLHLQGEEFKMTQADVQQVNRRNERFTFRDPLADAILCKFKPTDDPQAERMTSKQIAKEIINDTGYTNISHSLLTKLGTTLNDTGFRRRKSNGKVCYMVERLGSGSIQTADSILSTALVGTE